MSSYPRIALISLFLFASAAPIIRAEDPAPSDAPAPGTAPAQKAPRKKNHPSTELEDRMDEMGGAYKKLRKQINDPAQNAASLALVAKIQAGTEKAIKLTPAKAADLPEADRAKFIADYQAGIKHLQGTLGKLEQALKANDNAEAAKILKEAGAEQKEGHKQFMRQES